MPSVIKLLFTLLPVQGYVIGPPVARLPRSACVMTDMHDNDVLYDQINDRWRWMVSSSGVERLTEVAAEAPMSIHDDMRTPVERMRDEKLAARDTRKWCLDRCLATGACEALEDLWQLSAAQVVKFCQQCAQEDGCVLDYGKAVEYMDHLGAAANEQIDTAGQ